MKTSSTLFWAAMALLFGTLIAYDLSLKAEYNKGTYKDPFRSFIKLEYKNFNVIEVNPSNRLGVMIQQSDTFDVRVADNVKNTLKIRQESSRLIIDLDLKDERMSFRKSLLIKCPVLKEIKADAIFTLNGKSVIKKDRFDTEINVSGFQQDSLKLTASNASMISLQSNRINRLTADIGVGKSSQSVLILDKSNQISSATLNIQNRGKLMLKDIPVEKFNYTISDSAEVNLTGVSLKMMRK